MKYTEGKWLINRDNDGDVNAVCSNYHGAICSFPKYYGVKPTISGIEELETNARLIADAGNTANQCGLLPSEILTQRNELLEALQECAKWIFLECNVDYEKTPWRNAVNAINKATQSS